MKIAIAGFHEGLAGQVSSWVELVLPKSKLVCFLNPEPGPPEVSPGAGATRASSRFCFPTSNSYRGYPLVYGENWPKLLRDLGVTHILCALPDPDSREKLIQAADSNGFTVPSVIHPSAVVLSDVLIGRGCIIEPMAYVGLGAELGEGCHLHAGSQVDHNSVIESFTTLNPGVIVAGNVRVGRKSMLNMGSLISNGITLGATTTVGAGAFVLRSFPSPGLRLFGTPAISR